MFFKCSFWTIYFKRHKEAFSQTFQIPHQFNLFQEYLVLMISANSEMTTYLKSPGTVTNSLIQNNRNSNQQPDPMQWEW